MEYTCQFNPERDIKPVDELPLEAYDTAYQYATGTISSDAITANKTFNGATLGQIKGAIRDVFVELECARVFGKSANAQSNEGKNGDNDTERSGQGAGAEN